MPDAVSAPTASSYDEVPYQSHALAWTHPGSLAAIGALYGLTAPSAERCRVLELGCATGGNLHSLATLLPQASFVGIDASSRQIAEAQERATLLGLDNVVFRAMNLLEVTADFGQFDYILCHGVYSWVPPAVADTILEICRRHLAPLGVAYVSYNTFPGWHIKTMIREMMAFHVRAIDDPQRKIVEARDFLHVLAELAPEQGGIYKTLLKREEEERDTDTDWYFFHEYLEDVNQPVYFHEFAERMAAKGLQYLGPARFTVWENNLPARTERMLEPLKDRVLREQYLDFIGNRTFRKSLFCHDAIPLAQEPKGNAIPTLYISPNAWPTSSTADCISDSTVEFRSASDARLNTNRPLVKLALWTLAEQHPKAMSFSDLWKVVEPRLIPGKDPHATAEGLAQVLLRCALSDVVHLSTIAPCLTSDVSLQPVAHQLTRLLASRNEFVVNLRHQLVDLSDLDRIVLRHLDGRHDHDALRARVEEAVLKEELELLDAGGNPLRDAERIKEIVATSFNPCLRRLAEKGLLLA
jgi:methyltransferase-like protein/2-polyprenyl-3-methyl-5-hydroxy-6-metoxy-1,4-benzoquinol methylase